MNEINFVWVIANIYIAAMCILQNNKILATALAFAWTVACLIMYFGG